MSFTAENQFLEENFAGQGFISLRKLGVNEYFTLSKIFGKKSVTNIVRHGLLFKEL